MNDRELLEKAARAAGVYPVTFQGNSCGYVRHDGSIGSWNPLTDDGDALRLVVDLGMTTLWFDKKTGRPEVVVGLSCGSGVVTEPLRSDPKAATRRAIVRAAAALTD